MHNKPANTNYGNVLTKWTDKKFTQLYADTQKKEYKTNNPYCEQHEPAGQPVKRHWPTAAAGAGAGATTTTVPQ